MSAVLGIKFDGHDTGAAVIADGKVFAISEERLSRVKHSPKMFPSMAIDYCLEAHKFRPKDIDLVVVDQVGLRNEQMLSKIFHSATNGAFTNAKLAIVNHHDAHAASAYYASPFENAAILVYDGAGERFRTHHGVFATETESFYKGVGNRIICIQKMTHARTERTFPYTCGIGKVYSFLSSDYLGFGPNNSGKLMGLAAYGDLSLFETIPEERWFKELHGQIICNAQFLIPGSDNLQDLDDKFIDEVEEFEPTDLKRGKGDRMRVHSDSLYHTPRLFDPIVLQRPRRTSDIYLPDQYYSSVASAAQHILERVSVSLGRRLREITGCEQLCVAGGLGLNLEANRMLLENVGFKSLYVQPAATDAGIPLGCALWGYHMLIGEPKCFEMNEAFLGKDYSCDEISVALEAFKGRVNWIRESDVAAKAAEIISQGKIVGWFEGASEYGPRALGHRSIIADPRRIEIRERLNERVKKREHWRPFAAAILLEHAESYFDLRCESPFMLLSAKAHRGIGALVPSVVHVDGSTRLQTVSHKEVSQFRVLIERFYRKSGVPMILNTSLNLAGEPIVETPMEAISLFLRSELDYLVVGDFWIEKGDIA